MATLEDQINLERLMAQGGIERYHYNKDKMMSKGLQSETLHGRALVYNLIHPLAEALDQFMQSGHGSSVPKQKLQGTDPAQIAYLSLISLVNGLSQGYTKLIKVAKHIGTRVETQLVIDEWIEQDGEVANEILKMAMKKTDLGYENKRAGVINKMRKDEFVGFWTDRERIQVGVSILNSIQKSLGIIKIERRHNRGKMPMYVLCTDETQAWIDKFHETNEVNHPMYKPSLIPPVDWTDIHTGGYHSDYLPRTGLARVY